MNYYIGVKGAHKIYASPTPPNNDEYIWFDTTGLDFPDGIVETQLTIGKNKLLLAKE